MGVNVARSDEPRAGTSGRARRTSTEMRTAASLTRCSRASWCGPQRAATRARRSTGSVATAERASEAGDAAGRRVPGSAALEPEVARRDVDGDESPRQPKLRQRRARSRDSESTSSDGRRRVVIENVTPRVDDGRFPVKRIVGDGWWSRPTSSPTATTRSTRVLRWCVRRRRRSSGTRPRWSPRQRPLARGVRRSTRSGRYEYTVEGWVDRFRTWAHDLRQARRGRAGRDRRPADRRAIVGGAPRRATDAADGAALTLRPPDSRRLAARPRAHSHGARPELDSTSSSAIRTVRSRRRLDAALAVDRRSASAPASPPGTSSSRARPRPTRSATAPSRTSSSACHYVGGARLRRAVPAADPSHRPPVPQGPEQRADREAATTPASRGRSASRRGRPHGDPPRARHAGRLPTRSSRRPASGASRSRSTSPSRRRPTIPWVQEHPEWFRARPDGTIQYAENPPKKYQDIYPFDFESERLARAVGGAATASFRFWIDHGVHDLPRRQPAHQGVPVLGVVPSTTSRRDHPEMSLPGRGVHAAEGHVPAGQARLQPVVHVLHLAQRRSGADASTSRS